MALSYALGIDSFFMEWVALHLQHLAIITLRCTEMCAPQAKPKYLAFLACHLGFVLVYIYLGLPKQLVLQNDFEKKLKLTKILKYLKSYVTQIFEQQKLIKQIDPSM